ncbi:MAG: hypothetical protein KAK00_07100, partial [Nanoarchaeota archaeon]|nr:hypothetical protein [Nanoarchaeota archaeon]
MTLRNYFKKYRKKDYSDDKLKEHLIRHGYDKDYVSKEIRKSNRKDKFVTIVILSLFLLIISSLFFFKPTIIGFYSYKGTMNLNISIWSSSDQDVLFSATNVYAGDIAYFAANLTNKSNEIVIDANCTIKILSNLYNMSYSASNAVYTYNITINNSGNHGYNISCVTSLYGSIDANDTVIVQDIPQCDSYFGWYIVSPSNPKTGQQFYAKLNYSDELCFLSSTCYKKYDNATISLDSLVSTSSSLTAALTYDDPSQKLWTLKGQSLGNTTINVTLINETNKCKKNLTYEFDSWLTSPNLSVSFPNSFTILRIGQLYQFNITFNNTGDDNSTNIDTDLYSQNNSIINISQHISISKVENETSYNEVINITPLSSGNLYLSLNTTTSYNSLSALMPDILGKDSSNIHVNYIPILSLINITFMFNSSNSTINLTNPNFYQDTDSYDNYSNVNITWTGNDNLSIQLTSGYLLNFSAINNFTGIQNITFVLNDTINDSVSQTIIIYSSNDTIETCNGLDDNFNNIIDEGCDEDSDLYCNADMTIKIGANLSSICSSTDTTSATTIANTDDCDDSNSTINPGASESLSVSQTCSDLVDNDCDGNIDSSDSGCKSGSPTVISDTGGSSSGGAVFTSPSNDVDDGDKEKEKDEEPEPAPEPITEKPSPPSSKSSTRLTIDKIVYFNEIKHQRHSEYIPGTGRTRITEKIRNTGLFTEKDIRLTITFPKEIIDTADKILSRNEFDIIEYDPKIEYNMGNLAPSETKEISYSIPGRLNQRAIDLIELIITKYNKSEQEKEFEVIKLETKIEETQEAVNITTTYEVDYENNITTFTINLSLKEDISRLENVDILMEIPKCMIEILEEEDLIGEIDFEIQNPDPLIIWHIGTIISEEELKLSLKAIADEDCLNKATVLAVARDIVFLKHEINMSRVWITAIFIFIFFFGTVFAAAFSKVIEHNKKHIFYLIKRILNLYKIGWTRDKIRAKLRKENLPKEEIEEALELNARDIPHYWLIRIGATIEESIIFILIILSFLDFFELLPADADFIKKVVSWALLFIIFYHASITRILFGFKKHAQTFWHHIKNLDFIILIGFMLMLSKDMFVFARSIIEPKSFTYDFLNLIARSQPIWELRLFNIGLLIIIASSIYIGFRKEIYSSSLSRVMGIFGMPKSIFSSIIRSITSAFLLLGFYFLIFDKIMEWLAISIDSHIVVILILVSAYFFLKHRHRIFKKNVLEEKAAQTFAHIDHFYDHFIDLFHYRKTLALGIIGMLILNMIVGIGIFFLPYLIARFDPLYSSFGQEGHSPLFLGENSLLSKSLESIPFDFLLASATLFTYIMNALAVMFILASLFWFWFWCVKNRHKPLFAFNEFAKLDVMNFIPLALMSVTIFILNPIFRFRPFYTQGKLGVDILSQLINMESIYPAILISLAVFLLSFIFLKLFRLTAVKLYITLSIVSLITYLYLFSNSIWTYLNQNTGISLVQYSLIALFSILFYVFGAVIAVIYSLIIIYNIKHKRINSLMHHNLHTIHHHNMHQDMLHGDKTARLSELIIKNTAEGHELFFIVEYLIHAGYPRKEIEKAIKIAQKDPRF